MRHLQYKTLTHRLMIFLGIGIALFSLPYIVFNVSLMHICSAACTLGRLMAAFRSEDPQLRQADCRNQTARLLRAFGLRRLDLTQPTYVWLDGPVNISGSCVDTATLLPPLSQAEEETKNACFNQTYSPADKLQVYPVMYQLQQNFTQRGLQIIMSDGSLLGSERHFGIIPWDDDIDFLILREQKFEIRELLIQLSYQDELSFDDTEDLNFHWRLSFMCEVDRTQPPQPRYGLSRLFPRKTCRIAADFFFADVLGDYFMRPEMPYVYSTRDVYPLTLRPFGPNLMWAPRNSRALTAAYYGGDYELSCIFEVHSSRFPCREKFTECDRLRRIYPFVSHAVLRQAGRDVSADVLVWRSQVMAIFVPAQWA